MLNYIGLGKDQEEMPLHVMMVPICDKSNHAECTKKHPRNRASISKQVDDATTRFQARMQMAAAATKANFRVT